MKLPRAYIPACPLTTPVTFSELHDPLSFPPVPETNSSNSSAASRTYSVHFTLLNSIPNSGAYVMCLPDLVSLDHIA